MVEWFPLCENDGEKGKGRRMTATDIVREGKMDVLVDRIAAKAAKILLSGGVIIYPTDTLYALGASAMDVDAVKRVNELKGRRDMPVSVALASTKNISEIAEITPPASRFARENLPGPYTLILPLKNRECAAHSLAPGITAGTGKIGVRVPDSPMALAILDKTGIPVTATSANLHGEEPSMGIETLLSKFDSIDMIVYAGMLPGQASTIVGFNGNSPGFISRDRDGPQDNTAEETDGRP